MDSIHSERREQHAAHSVDPKTLLSRLYDEQLRARPEDAYLKQHSQEVFLRAGVELFDFYAPYIRHHDGRVLDWGCRHAPDSCLIRAHFGSAMRMHGCDVVAATDYPIFHQYASLEYAQLDHVTRLPYDDEVFDTVVASGTLEHVAMDYESLKELYRVLRDDGVLIITYLPNWYSISEWYREHVRRADFHRRRYRLREAVQLLKHSGFYPLRSGYHSRMDVLPSTTIPQRVLRSVSWVLPVYAFVSTLLIVVSKQRSM